MIINNGPTAEFAKLKELTLRSDEAVKALEAKVDALEKVLNQRSHPLLSIDEDGNIISRFQVDFPEYTFTDDSSTTVAITGADYAVPPGDDSFTFFNIDGEVISQMPSYRVIPWMETLFKDHPAGVMSMVKSLANPAISNHIGRVAVSESDPSLSGNVLQYTLHPHGRITDVVMHKSNGSFCSLGGNITITKESLGICETSSSSLPTTAQSLFISAWNTWL